MKTLDEVKSWMRFMGWQNGGEPGSTKYVDGFPSARHGDATWISDMEEACDRVERQNIVAEIERRDRAAASKGVHSGSREPVSLYTQRGERA